ncbi:MAG: hypothetical protein KDC52_20835 [Ignavibacteriae bacterium]|nr:hypothetical protein [Ignavibacteriota bacterium]
MDMIKQNRNLIITIIVLVIINIVALLLLWLGKPKNDFRRGLERDSNDKVRIQKMLKEELGFSTEQAKQFITLREELKEKTTELNDDLMLLKKEMFEKVMHGNSSSISDSLLNLTLEKQGEIEKATFEHFLKLKQICTPEQQEKLFKLMHRLLGPPTGGPRGETRDELPPPPGEHPPIRN